MTSYYNSPTIDAPAPKPLAKPAPAPGPAQQAPGAQPLAPVKPDPMMGGGLAPPTATVALAGMQPTTRQPFIPDAPPQTGGVHTVAPSTITAAPAAAAPPPPPTPTGNPVVDQRAMDAYNEERFRSGGAAPVAPGAAPAAGAPGAAPAADPGVAPPWMRNNGNAITTTDTPAWAGGPNVTQTAVDRSGMPAIRQGTADRAGLPQLSDGLDTSGFADFDQDFAGAASRGADAAYRGATQYMDEDFGRDNAALESKLVNQGFARGTEAFDNEMAKQMRSQNAAKQNAAFMAQGVGHQQSGDLLMRALESRRLQGAEAGQDAATRLASRGMLGNEITGDVDRTFAQSLAARGLLGSEAAQDADRRFGQSSGIAGLNLGSRAQDRQVEAAMHSASGQAAAAAAAQASNRYSTDTSRDLRLRELGMGQDQQNFSNMMALINASRGGVNMPNFGNPAPLDVGSANAIASNNANTDAARQAQDRAGMYGLGANVLSNVNWGSLFGGP